jgi:hypothetical protein
MGLFTTELLRLTVVSENSGLMLAPVMAGSICQCEPRCWRGASWAAITRHGIVSPRRSSPVRGVASTRPCRTSGRGSPSRRYRHRPGELIAAQLPQILVMHDASHSSQVGARSGEPPRGNQDLGRGQDAHHHSMGTCRAR